MDNPNQSLLYAIAFIDHPGVDGDFKAQMEIAIENGADVNGISQEIFHFHIFRRAVWLYRSFRKIAE